MASLELGPVWHAARAYSGKGGLSVSKGDRLVQVMSGDDDPGEDWVRVVSASGNQGLVPRDRVQLRGLVCAWAYSPREDGELAVVQGETVDEIGEAESFGDEWVLVRSRTGNQAQGLVPKSYFEEPDSEDEEPEDEKPVEQDLLSVKKAYEGTEKDKLPLALGDVVALVKPKKFSAKPWVTVRSLVTGEVGEVPGANVTPLVLKATASFAARNSSELTLKIGDVVQAYLMSNEGLQLYGEDGEDKTPAIGAGWIRGRRRRSSACGLVPWSFMEPEGAAAERKKAKSKKQKKATDTKKKNATTAPPKHAMELRLLAAVKVEPNTNGMSSVHP